jgi:hypothetical protein
MTGTERQLRPSGSAFGPKPQNRAHILILFSSPVQEVETAGLWTMVREQEQGQYLRTGDETMGGMERIRRMSRV